MVVRNYVLCIIYVALLVLLSCVLLLPPNGLTALWHVASHAYNSPDTTSPVWQAYQVSSAPILMRINMPCIAALCGAEIHQVLTSTDCKDHGGM